MLNIFSTFNNPAIDKKLLALLDGSGQPANLAASPAEADILVLARRGKSSGADDPLACYDGTKPAVLVAGRADGEGLALAEEAARRGIPPDMILLLPEGATAMPLADVAAAARRALRPQTRHDGENSADASSGTPAGGERLPGGEAPGVAAWRASTPGEGNKGDGISEDGPENKSPETEFPASSSGPPICGLPAAELKEISNLRALVAFSPGIPRIGVTTFAMETAEILSRRGPVTIADADFAKPGLGVRLGIAPAALWDKDWRAGAGAVKVGNRISALVLDPYLEEGGDPAEIAGMLKMPRGAVVVDAGCNPETAPWAEILPGPCAGIMLVESDPLSVVRASRRWRAVRGNVSLYAIVVAVIDGDKNAVGELSEILGVPCFPLRRASGGFALEDAEKILAAAAQLAREARKSGPPIYVLGKGAGISGARFFDSANELAAAVEERVPAAVAVSAGVAGAKELVKLLRREAALDVAPIGVFGTGSSQEWYGAGADACYEVLDAAAVEDLMGRKKRMVELKESFSCDPLTGCLRRDSLESALAAQAARFSEAGAPFSVLMLDLDHFKTVNDNYGHQAGDAVLAAFGEFLRSSVRKVDMVFRYGGEEFLAVLPGVRAEQALEVGERLRAGWAANEIRLPGGEVVRSTLSGGVAEFGRHSLDAGALVEAADKALYKAKEAGRDGVRGA